MNLLAKFQFNSLKYVVLEAIKQKLKYHSIIAIVRILVRLFSRKYLRIYTENLISFCHQRMSSTMLIPPPQKKIISNYLVGRSMRKMVYPACFSHFEQTNSTLQEMHKECHDKARQKFPYIP